MTSSVCPFDNLTPLAVLSILMSCYTGAALCLTTSSINWRDLDFDI